MIDYQIYAGYASVLVEIVSYLIYFTGIARGKTKPHAFTWLVWGVLNVVAFFAVLAGGGKMGAWVLGVNALACLAISIIGFYQKRIKYDLYDWLALAGGFVGIFLWWLTKDPLYAVILVTLSDGIGAIPMFRKAYRLPFEENVSSFAMGLFYYPLSILALQSLTLTTWLYPVAVVLIDGTLVVMILIRRRKTQVISSPRV